LNQTKVEDLVKTLLSEIGEDPKREGLISTPKRFAKAYEFLTSGYHQDIKKVMNRYRSFQPLRDTTRVYTFLRRFFVC